MIRSLLDPDRIKASSGPALFTLFTRHVCVWEEGRQREARKKERDRDRGQDHSGYGFCCFCAPIEQMCVFLCCVCVCLGLCKWVSAFKRNHFMCLSLHMC